jgi:hypothetical protein
LVEVEVFCDPDAGFPKFQLYVKPDPVLELLKLIGVDEQGALLGEKEKAAFGDGRTVTTTVTGVAGEQPEGVTV